MRIVFLSSFLVFTSISMSAQTTTAWQLYWSDEFNGSANTPPDPTKWNYDLGGGGWGNGEQETYTNSLANAFQDGQGHLVIRAIRDQNGNYTSARLRTGATSPTDTANLNWQYGKIEARIKLPYGPGIWPAFWMLGADITSVPWPGCGEIDILENFGAHIDDASTVHGTIHGPNYQGTGIGAAYQLPLQETFTSDFHIFSIEWSQNSASFFVDGANYETVTPASLPAGGSWVFNDPFFILLNLAIGGPTTFLGTPTATTPSPQDMLIDYVRVYHATAIGPTTPAIAPGGIVNAASGLGGLTPGALAALYGANLAEASDTSAFTNGAFPTSSLDGATVSVNGVNAPLVFVSPGQINFEIPWETPLAPAAVTVTVTRSDSGSSFAEPVTIDPAAPAAFLDYSDSVSLIAVYPPGPVTSGAVCVLYGTGFGPGTTALQDGVPATGGFNTVNSCTLSIAGQPATVQYCGTAPGEVIDQLNFVYPVGVPPGTQPVIATLTVNGITGTFLVPVPAS